MRDRFPLLVLALIVFALAGGWLLQQSASRGRFAEPLSTYRSAPCCCSPPRRGSLCAGATSTSRRSSPR